MKGCVFQGKGEGKRLCTVGRQADDEKEASAMKKGNHHCKKAGEKGRWNDGEITLNEGIKKEGIHWLAALKLRCIYMGSWPNRWVELITVT